MFIVTTDQLKFFRATFGVFVKTLLKTLNLLCSKM